MKPDIINQYCIYNDYPIFREHLKKYRYAINKIILYPSRHHGFRDFEDYAKQTIKETWVDPVPIDFGKEDWRQAETIPCLKHLKSDWVWFREQDFFVDDWIKFYEDVKELQGQADMFGWWHDSAFSYMHPCCLFIKRELLDQTQKDFRAHSEIDGCDHFAMITRDAEKLGATIVKLQDIGYENWVNAFHMAGLTYPYQNWSTDRIFGVGNLEAYYVYNYYSRKYPAHEEYIKLSFEIEDYLNRHKNLHRLNVGASKWRKFFV